MIKYLAFVSIITSFSSEAGFPYGKWSTECEADNVFNLQISNELSELVVNDNQIVIQYSSNIGSSNKISLFYTKPLDLGRGGMLIEWSHVSYTSKIAELIYSGGKGALKWNGFYDVQKGTYFWMTDPDFVQNYAENGTIALEYCNY